MMSYFYISDSESDPDRGDINDRNLVFFDEKEGTKIIGHLNTYDGRSAICKYLNDEFHKNQVKSAFLKSSLEEESVANKRLTFSIIINVLLVCVIILAGYGVIQL